MKTFRLFALLLLFLFTSPSLSAQSGPVISIGKKKIKEVPVAKSELAAGKLSALYFKKMNRDTTGMKIQSYHVTVYHHDQGSTLDLASPTDAFPERIAEMITDLPAKSKITFDNIKAVDMSTGRKLIQLLDPLTLKVKAEE